eukprot:762419-Hanusia_phi.AAC.5
MSLEMSTAAWPATSDRHLAPVATDKDDTELSALWQSFCLYLISGTFSSHSVPSQASLICVQREEAEAKEGISVAVVELVHEFLTKSRT